MIAAPGAPIARPVGARAGAQRAGAMFMFWRNTLAGS